MAAENPESRVTIRRANDSDLETLLDLIHEYCLADGHPVDRATARSALVPLLADDRFGAVWLVDTGPTQRGIGYACVTWGYSIEAGGPEALFDELYVRDQGQGIGTRVMELVLAEVRRRGFRRVYLESEAHNDRGRQLYERLGFVVEDSVWMSLDWRD